MKKRMQPVVLAVIRRGNAILLTKRADRYRSFDKKWQLPGGSVNFGEDVVDALYREVREEVGVQVRIIGLIPKIYHKVRGDWHGLFICFECELIDTSAHITLNEEATAYGWYTREQIDSLDVLPLVAEIVTQLDT